MTDVIENINIVSYNCKSIKRSVQTIRDLLHTTDLLLLQETWLLPHDLNFVDEVNQEFGCSTKSSVDTSIGPLRGRPHGGLAILWNKLKFPNVSTIKCNSDRVMAVKITTDCIQFLVINVYMPVDILDNLTEFTDCLALVSAIVEESDVQIAYILGDFNAHPPTRFGQELENFVKEQEWECADLNFMGRTSNCFTFVSEAHGCQRWLDHCIVTKAAWETVTSVDILYDIVWSDHYPIRVTCNIKGISLSPSISDNCDALRNIRWGERDENQRLMYSKCCFESLNEYNDNFNINLCNCKTIITCSHFNDYTNLIDRMYCNITTALKSAAIKSSHKFSKSRKSRIVGWNYHIRESHQNARFHFSEWVLGGKPSEGYLFAKMRESRRIFKNKIKWCQKHEESIKMEILATHCRNKNFSKFWNATKMCGFKQNLPASMDGVQGSSTIADVFAKKFKITPQPVERVPDVKTAVCETPLQFSLDDLLRTVRNIKRGKSPGHDGLSIEHVLYGGNKLFEHLVIFYNLCIKYCYLPRDLMKTVVVPIVKNKTADICCSDNYRPISLGTIIGKILERLIYPSLHNSLDIDDAQFGFRPNLSTDMAIMSLKNTVNYYTSKQTSVYACFLDLSRAFDLVNYKILWGKLTEARVPADVKNLLRFWYENQINNVRWGDTTSSDFRLECGVRQGGLTSPDLFNLYINGLIEELRGTRVGCYLGDVCVNNLSYADDMVLLSPSVKGLKKLLLVCEKYASSHGLKYNAKKTEMMVFRSGRGPDRVPEVQLNGTTIALAERFKYLGHWLTETHRDDEDIERERRALAVRSNMLARRFGACNTEVKNTLFRAYCLSMYTCQLWTNYTRKAINAIRVQYNDAYRTLMRLPRYCSASGMFFEARIPDFFAVVRSRIASFWCRLGLSRNRILRAVSDMIHNNTMYQHWTSVHLDGNKK